MSSRRSDSAFLEIHLYKKNGIDIFAKKMEEAAVTTVRGRRKLKVPSSRLKNVINFINTSKQWGSNFIQGQNILSLSNNVNIC